MHGVMEHGNISERQFDAAIEHMSSHDTRNFVRVATRANEFFARCFRNFVSFFRRLDPRGRSYDVFVNQDVYYA